MAVLKIYESQIAPKSPNVPQTGALTIPVGLATQYGQALSSVGKVVMSPAPSVRHRSPWVSSERI